MGFRGHRVCGPTGHAPAIYPTGEIELDRTTHNFRSENYFAVDHGAN